MASVLERDTPFSLRPLFLHSEPGSGALLQVKDLLARLGTGHSQQRQGVCREAESEGPEANDQAAAEAAKARRTGRRKPLEDPTPLCKEERVLREDQGGSVVCAGGMDGQRADMTRGDLIASCASRGRSCLGR